jgi:hypothetical protein
MVIKTISSTHSGPRKEFASDLRTEYHQQIWSAITLAARNGVKQKDARLEGRYMGHLFAVGFHKFVPK